MGAQVATLSEENRVLKRGMNILEGRLRESTNHIENEEKVIAQAAQYISDLERTVYTLRSQLYSTAGSGVQFITPQPPPDVS